MNGSYCKFAAESIAKGLGKKTIQRFGTCGRVLGRTGAVVGIGFLAYEFFKNYKTNIESEPDHTEMMILQAELKKWTSAISCLGSKPIEPNEYGAFDEGGAINALYRKKKFIGQAVEAADPKEAYILIGRSMNYIRQTKNLLNADEFEEKRQVLVSRLRKAQLKINDSDDYRPIQRELVRIVEEIRPVAAGYASRIYECSRKIQKTIGSNAAWAAISMATLGLVKKPQNQQT